MKKLLVLVLALTMMLTFAACGSEEPAASEAPAETATSEAPAEETPAEEAPAEEATTEEEVAEEVVEEEVVEEEMYALDFTLGNYSNADLVDIRISASTDEDWGDNLLEEGYVLPNGNSVEIVFDSMAPAGTLYDMYTEDSDGDAYEYYEISLTELTTLDLYVEVAGDGSYTNYYETDIAG